MPLRNSIPVTWSPAGVTDSLDGTNSFPGSMMQASDIIPAHSTRNFWIPRPAAIKVTSFGTFTAPTNVTAFLVVGDLVYGMVSTGRFPGFDEPFVYNLKTNAFLTLSGVTAALVPATQPTSGDWTPPRMDVVGQYILVCHPGFSGGSGPYFGWFDISSFTDATTGDTASGSAVISGNPNIAGVTPGQLVTGAGIPAGAYVKSLAPFVLDTTGTTSGDIHLTSLASTTGVAVGQTVAGAGIPLGATVAAIVSGTAVDISSPATASASDVAITFSGATITLSANATATANGVSINLAGGTPTNPLWGAGNTNINPLVAVPVDVKQMAGAANFGVKTALVESDSLNPLQVSQPSQIVTFANGLDVTAIGGLPFNNQLGGIVQSLMVFQGANAVQQILGSTLLGNRSVNIVRGAPGTLGANTITSIPTGLAFVAVDGVRVIDENGNVGDPIGANGSGVSLPFIYALFPSRMAAAWQHSTLRIAVQNDKTQNAPAQEWWFDTTVQQWSGPHTFVSSLLQPWVGTTFICSQQNVPALYSSDDNPGLGSIFVENGQPMQFAFQTSLLPDNGLMAENCVVETAIMMALAQGEQIIVQAMDEEGISLDQLTMQGTVAAGALWGSSVWGAFLWGATGGAPRQERVPWHQPLVFKQMSVRVSGASSGDIIFGPLRFRYQRLGYLVERVA